MVLNDRQGRPDGSPRQRGTGLSGQIAGGRLPGSAMARIPALALPGAARIDRRPLPDGAGTASADRSGRAGSAPVAGGSRVAAGDGDMRSRWSRGGIRRRESARLPVVAGSATNCVAAGRTMEVDELRSTALFLLTPPGEAAQWGRQDRGDGAEARGHGPPVREECRHPVGDGRRGCLYSSPRQALSATRRGRNQVGAGEPRVHAGSLHPADPGHRPRDACRRTPTRRPPRKPPGSTDGAADLPKPGHPPRPEPGRVRRAPRPRGVAAPAIPAIGPRDACRRTPTGPGHPPAPRTYPNPAARRGRNQVGAASPASTRGRCTRDPSHRPRKACRRTPTAPATRRRRGPTQTRPPAEAGTR